MGEQLTDLRELIRHRGDNLPWVIAKEMMSKLLSFASDQEQDELKSLQETAEMVQALIFDATTNGKTHLESVGIWLKKLNTVAYDADAVLEDFNYQTLRLKREEINPNMDKVRHQFRLKITSINNSLDEIYKQGTQIGLVRLQGVKDAPIEHTEIQLTHPFLYDSEVIGMEEDVLRTVHNLCFSENENHLSVMAIVGMGGLGKTTLARLVCNQETVVRYFDEIIWITVSDNFDVTRLLNEMVQALTGKNPLLSNVNEIVKNELGRRLERKRYLLVLDDVWNEDEDKWDCFRKALLGIGTSRGSKIMVTTRIGLVALTMQSSFIHRLSSLSDDKSCALFQRIAFAEGGAMKSLDMVHIGNYIVKRCRGVPLALRALGGLMFFKNSKTEWLSILSSWQHLDERNPVLAALGICYEHLPSPLKHCFAFCSIFPKDFDLEKNNLIQLWMALGLLRPPKNSDLSMENIGNNYFNILFFNSMLQDAKKNEYGSITSCKRCMTFFTMLLNINQIIIAQIWRLFI